MISRKVSKSLVDSLFLKPGATVMYDGQFGSTGKGLVASVLAEVFAPRSTVDIVMSNAGPNSGHTSYTEVIHHDRVDRKKSVLRQLPTYSVVADLLGYPVDTWMSHGAIISPSLLLEEVNNMSLLGAERVSISPFAAVVSSEDLETEKSLVGHIGSTGKGTGSAAARKVMRDLRAVAGANTGIFPHMRMWSPDYEIAGDARILLEVSQGHSLGINAGFYPHCTSRGCGVNQALNDANIHPSYYSDSVMVVRTYPIRVAGNSGPSYPDQDEIQWGDLNVEPEITTVTKKVRRVFKWSPTQFREAVLAGRPSSIFLTFCDYLVINGIDVETFVRENIVEPYMRLMGSPPIVYVSFGPYTDNVELY